MNNALVLLIETPGITLSENTLETEISPELAVELCDYLTDMSISELYPVTGAYDFFLLSYTPEETIRLQKRVGDNFRFLAASGETQMEFLLDALSRLQEYEHIIFLKSNTNNISEESVAAFFDRLKEFDILFGPSESTFYTFGIHRDTLEFLTALPKLNQEELDNYETENALNSFHLPELAIAETLGTLTKLRQSLPTESGLARKIDDIIIRATAAELPDE